MAKQDETVEHNQVVPLADYNLYDTDRILTGIVSAHCSCEDQSILREHGDWLGRADTLEAGRLANRHAPELVQFDVRGQRIDRVDFHPAWHHLMGGMIQRGLHNGAPPGSHPHLRRAAAYLMQGQVEAGTLCPVTMTFAALPLLEAAAQTDGDFFTPWVQSLRASHYHPGESSLAARTLESGRPVAALVGMGLTEKQGGSDLRTCNTTAQPLSADPDDPLCVLTGHKWFFSVPQSDAHLVLARQPQGLSCFLVPRLTPDGARNGILINRLKDKLGNRSNASAEVVFEGAWAHRVGDPGRGLPALLRMATSTRLDCVLGSTALLRQALVQALHHTSHRFAFGRALIEQPVMAALLADLALESEASTRLSLALAQCMDDSSMPARALARVGIPAAKFWICKRVISAIAECLEALGGNGYVEEGPIARLYREAPVNSVWEGSGNIMALDVLRGFAQDDTCLDALLHHWQGVRRDHPAFGVALAHWLRLLDAARTDQALARPVAACLVRMWQAALMIEAGHTPSSDAFVATRLAGGERMWGEFDHPPAAALILAHHWPLL